VRRIQEYAAAHTPLGKGAMTTLAVTTEGLGPDAVLVTLEGELAFGQALTFDEALRKSEERDARCIVLDLRELLFIDSAGVKMLLVARRRAARAGRRIIIVEGPPAVRRLFAIAGLADAFELVEAIPGDLRAPAGERVACRD
jgi:anti-sigma B factor antagonist